MLETYPALSLLPPLLAILVALLTRQVVPALFAGVLVGSLLIHDLVFFAALDDALELCVSVFDEGWRTKVILFTFGVGSLLLLLQKGGGVEGFVRWAERRPFARSRRGAQILAWLIGLGVFVESNITCLVVGCVARPLFDRLKLSREKLAWICDSTSAPVCMLLPINGWGATVLALLAVQAEAGILGDLSPLEIFIAAVPLNFYAWFAVILVLVSILRGWDIGPMKEAERRARDEGKVLRDGARPVVDPRVTSAALAAGAKPHLITMLGPLLLLFFAVPAGILITGLRGMKQAGLTMRWGESDSWVKLLGEASGSTAVFWAVLAALALLILILALQRSMRFPDMIDTCLEGAGGMMPLALIMTLAFAIGMTALRLGTGPWLAETLIGLQSPALLAPLVFLCSAGIAFATGTSWGTFGIMIPLAMPLAAQSEAHALVLAALLGGAVFGDHCSPISDTTLVASMASGSDHVDHVRTQLPLRPDRGRSFSARLRDRRSPRRLKIMLA